MTQPAQSHTAGGGGDLNWLLSALRAGLLTGILCFAICASIQGREDAEGGVSTSDSGYNQLQFVRSESVLSEKGICICFLGLPQQMATVTLKFTPSLLWTPDVQSQGFKQGHAALKSPGASGGSRHSWASACITPISASLLHGSPLCFSSSSASSLCPAGMLGIGFRTHPVNLGCCPHLKVLNYTCQDPFPKQVSVHRYLKSGCEHTILGTTIQTTSVFFIFALQRRQKSRKDRNNYLLRPTMCLQQL